MSEDPVTGRDRSRSAEDVVCPTCGRDDFADIGGMRKHHAAVHGESLLQQTAECRTCGDDFEVKPGSDGKFCSRECHFESMRDRVEIECHNCGESFDAEAKQAADGRKFCSHDCYAASLEDRDEYECASCGRDYSVYPSAGIKYCSRACMFEDRTSKPRPDDLDGLLWVLYVYEEHNARETWLRANAHLEDWLTQESVRQLLRENDWMAQDGRPKYADLTWEDVGIDPPDNREETWRKYYRDGDGSEEVSP